MISNSNQPIIMEEARPLVATSMRPEILPSSSSVNNNPTLIKKNLTSNEAEIAIKFSKAHHSYGKKVPVLMGLNMRIPKGAIYGLLGPSGCGKTTLLQCIVGKQTLKSGEVHVFGGKPGSKISGVPGSRVGYMPQELALYSEFTLRETLNYFGHIFGMDSIKINERTEFLIEFLDLPKGKRLIRELSGGQQRRASLAAALLQEPELLILDEPTVGVDPLLRQCIWNHLLHLSSTAQISTTIVITTHYIEEARQADVVGMMRFGKLLAEDSPDNLLQIYEKPNLESVFLHLCLSDSTERGDLDESPNKITVESKNSVPLKPWTNGIISEQNTNAYNEDTKSIPSTKKKTSPHALCSLSICDWIVGHRLRALLVKNFIRMWRNLGFLTFQFIIPTVQVTLFCLAIGRDPTGLTMAVVNGENSDQCQYYTDGCIMGNKDEFLGYDDDRYHLANLSCRFLSYINPDFVRPVYVQNLEQALDEVRRGKHWGVLEFHSKYSDSLYDRFFNHIAVTNDTLAKSDVHVYLDMTNQQIGYTIQLRLSEAYEKFAQDLLTSCDVPKKLASLPIAFEDPVYGSIEPTFTEFMAPGVILSITYFMAVGLTALSFILERKEGLLERSWVAGVTATEVMFAHVVAQCAVMIVQVALVLVFMIYVFGVPAEGPMVWVVCLTLLQGLCGMAFGLVVSALCDNEQDAIQLALGSFYPNLLLSGIIWPLEGMLPELRYLSYILPQTYACEAMRGMLSRGWGLLWPQVYTGYLVTIAWIVIQLVLSAFILKVRR